MDSGDEGDIQLYSSWVQIDFRGNYFDDVCAKFLQLFWSSWNTALDFSYKVNHCFVVSMYFHLYQKAQQNLKVDHLLRALNLYDWMKAVFYLSDVLPII